ncbi:MAG: AsmA family protein [Candidatus Binataceae bacterium]
MRRAWIIGGSIVGVVILGLIALFIYVIVSLNSIVQRNRGYVAARASSALGRKIEVNSIRASLGWGGVVVDLSGVKIADDPSFSRLPMLTAQDIYCKVRFLPLVSRKVRISSLVINDPHFRVERNAAGVLSISTLGKPVPGNVKIARPAGIYPTPMGTATPRIIATPSPGKALAQPIQAAPESGNSFINTLRIRNFSIANGTVFYSDPRWGTQPIVIKRVDLGVKNFRTGAPFPITLKLAMLDNIQDVKFAGTVGPLMRNGALDFQNAPVALNVTAGPLQLADVRVIGPLAAAIPQKLTIYGQILATGKVSGTLNATNFTVNGDMRPDHVIYTGLLDKAAGVPLIFRVSGSRKAAALTIDRAHAALAGLNLEASNVVVANGKFAAKLDTNRFDLAQLAPSIAPLRQYKASGQAELHAAVVVVNHHPNVNGTLTLADVGLSPGGKIPALAGLSGALTMAGNTAEIGPLKFTLGGGHAQLKAHASSIQPLNATYSFSVDKLNPAALAPAQMAAAPAKILNLKAAGTLAGTPAAPEITTNASSSSGVVNNIAYNNLSVAAQYTGEKMTVRSLKLGAFSGAISAAGQTLFGVRPHFTINANLANVDLHQALASQRLNAAEIVRGLVSGNFQIAGAGRSFDQIMPTLSGNGKLTMRNGKLVGVNVAATALKKVDNVPGIGALLPSGVIERHPELFSNPDTDINQASMSFLVRGPRVSTHDLVARAADYTITGHGWFGFDRRLDMAAHLLLTPQFSKEIRSEKKNAVYLENKNGEIDIPLRISGQLPKPTVVPDAAEIAQRAAHMALRRNGRKYIDKLFHKKGLGGLFGAP